jgi:hypothetical protein
LSTRGLLGYEGKHHPVLSRKKFAKRMARYNELARETNRRGPTMYSAFGLLKPDSDFTMTEAASRLSAKLPSFAVDQEADKLVVSSADWEIHLVLNGSPTVLAESREIAGHIGGADDARDIALCARRIEVASDVPDPEMNHFNDYLLVIEVLQSFKGLIAVDPKEPSLL